MPIETFVVGPGQTFRAHVTTELWNHNLMVMPGGSASIFHSQHNPFSIGGFVNGGGMVSFPGNSQVLGGMGWGEPDEGSTQITFDGPEIDQYD